MGRPSLMHDEENVRDVAEMFASGATRAEIAAEYGVSKDTVSQWHKRPEVQAYISVVSQDRVGRILSRVDSELEKRLTNIDQMPTEDILRIRKELLPHRIEVSTGDVDEAKAAEELLEQHWRELEEGTVDGTGRELPSPSE